MQTLSKAELHVAPIIFDFIENDTVESCRSFLDHMGLDVAGLPLGCGGNVLLAAVVEHYTDDDGNFEPNGILTDLETWPPIANRVAELKREREAGVN